MISPTEGRAWSEAAGELRYLSIRLQGYIAELPNLSLPPRGRVQWSQAELGELGVLTRALAVGEEDANRAVASMDAIQTLIQRGDGDVAAGSIPGGHPVAAEAPAEVSLLERYITQRAIAMDSLPRLQRLGEPGQAATRTARPPLPTRDGQSFWSRTLAKVLSKRPR